MGAQWAAAVLFRRSTILYLTACKLTTLYSDMSAIILCSFVKKMSLDRYFRTLQDPSTSMLIKLVTTEPHGPLHYLQFVRNTLHYIAISVCMSEREIFIQTNLDYFHEHKLKTSNNNLFSSLYIAVCVSVCVWEMGRERQRDRERLRKRRVCV